MTTRHATSRPSTPVSSPPSATSSAIPRDRSRVSGIAVVTLACLLFGPLPSSPAQQDRDTTALTIYSTAKPGAISPELYKPTPGQIGGNYGKFLPGYAIVKQERTLSLPNQRTVLRFTDVPAHIEPTTVRFTSLTDPQGTQVIEQSYEFDLVSTEKLLQRFLDKQITLVQVRGDATQTITGKLLSTTGGMVLQDSRGGVKIVSGYADVQLPELPGGLITKPTLVWDVHTPQPGDHRVRVTYETKAMTWWADYNIVYSPGADANSGLLDIGAWVTIVNRSGASYPDAKLKLIAGDVHRAPQPAPRAYAMKQRRMSGVIAGADMSGFAEKSFFEYHLYTLGRPTTLPDNATKQIELFPPARKVPCEKVMVYAGQDARFGAYYGSPMTDRNFGVQSNKKVATYLRFKNEEAIGMGMPLPSGRIRVSQRDEADDTLEFIGEDVIDHTPKKEQVLIKLGNAFDVVGERTQTDFKIDTVRKTIDEDIEIKVRNHKEEPVKVLIKESLYRWSTWRVSEASHKYDKLDSRTIHFPVDVPADGEVTITYSVHYSW